MKASGVTATAHNWDGADIEKELFENGCFKIYPLFKNSDLPEVLDWKGKSYNSLTKLMIEPKFRKYAVLMIGWLQDVSNFASEDFHKVLKPLDDSKHPKMILDERRVYYLKDLENAWSMDFWPDGKKIEGIILALISPAPNWRTYQQWLGRVGR